MINYHKKNNNFKNKIVIFKIRFNNYNNKIGIQKGRVIIKILN
jgi:hypothetical protein